MTEPDRKRGKLLLTRGAKRAYWITVRVSEQEANSLYNAARDAATRGRTKLSAWIREKALEAAEKRRTPRNPCGG